MCRAVVCHRGRSPALPQPANGYVMKAYPLGSVTKLLQNICYRWAGRGRRHGSCTPEAAAQRCI